MFEHVNVAMLAQGAEDSASLRQIGWCWLDSDVEGPDLCWAGRETECLGHDRNLVVDVVVVVLVAAVDMIDIRGTYPPLTESVFLDNPSP